ncbi:hypothetical protein, partial [Endozoicomonas sp. ONNA1]|uniref:hypothetical protein n=1 Tax=Endozoicomonas sp. ONNA1 TaxID=2828740 RepID=UPI00214777C0
CRYEVKSRHAQPDHKCTVFCILSFFTTPRISLAPLATTKATESWARIETPFKGSTGRATKQSNKIRDSP